MKVEQEKPPFEPVFITLETPEDLNMLRSFLTDSNCYSSPLEWTEYEKSEGFKGFEAWMTRFVNQLNTCQQ